MSDPMELAGGYEKILMALQALGIAFAEQNIDAEIHVTLKEGTMLLPKGQMIVIYTTGGRVTIKEAP